MTKERRPRRCQGARRRTCSQAGRGDTFGAADVTNPRLAVQRWRRRRPAQLAGQRHLVVLRSSGGTEVPLHQNALASEACPLQGSSTAPFLTGSTTGRLEGPTRRRSYTLQRGRSLGGGAQASGVCNPSIQPLAPVRWQATGAPCPAHRTNGSPPATQNCVLLGRQCTLFSSRRPRLLRQASRRRAPPPGSRRSKCLTSPSAGVQVQRPGLGWWVLQVVHPDS